MFDGLSGFRQKGHSTAFEPARLIQAQGLVLYEFSPIVNRRFGCQFPVETDESNRV
jgi:hypothetical protein